MMEEIILQIQPVTSRIKEEDLRRILADVPEAQLLDTLLKQARLGEKHSVTEIVKRRMKVNKLLPEIKKICIDQDLLQFLVQGQDLDQDHL